MKHPTYAMIASWAACFRYVDFPAIFGPEDTLLSYPFIAFIDSSHFFTRLVFQRCNIKYSSYEDRLAQANLKSVQYRRVLQILRTYHNIITGNFHYPNVSSSVKKAVTPRYPYMLRSVGETNKGFLRANLATWNRLAKQIPEKLNRSMFASRLNSSPLNILIPPT
nr:hypothetical protein T02G5.10 - Caenorhabditis elegans [Caenorhabditis elegans]